jgi:hypothetical protein
MQGSERRDGRSAGAGSGAASAVASGVAGVSMRDLLASCAAAARERAAPPRCVKVCARGGAARVVVRLRVVRACRAVPPRPQRAGGLVPEQLCVDAHRGGAHAGSRGRWKGP